MVFVQLDLGTKSGYEALENPQQDEPSEETLLTDKMNNSTTAEKRPPLENGYGAMKGSKLSVEEAYKKKETEPERSNQSSSKVGYNLRVALTSSILLL